MLKISLVIKQYSSFTKRELQPILNDYCKIHVKSGRGGNGNKFTGGIGGKGGSVYVIGDDKLVSLKNMKKALASPGGHTKYKNTVGLPAENINIKAPVGTRICCGNDFIDEIKYNGEEILIAEGGEGGNSKNGFAGKLGVKKMITLDYNLIGDIALVGFPNAGKSTLLKSITRANPRIGDHPFTTICPQTGVVEFEDGRELLVVDLPGLVSDETTASVIGMSPGQRFLKHLSRVKIILNVVDVDGFQLTGDSDQFSAIDTVLVASKVIEEFDESFAAIPRILAVNKIDDDPNFDKRQILLDFIRNIPGSLQEIDELKRPKSEFKFREIFEISGKDGKGTQEMMKYARRLIDELDSSRRRTYLDVVDIKLREYYDDKFV